MIIIRAQSCRGTKQTVHTAHFVCWHKLHKIYRNYKEQLIRITQCFFVLIESLFNRQYFILTTFSGLNYNVQMYSYFSPHIIFYFCISFHNVHDLRPLVSSRCIPTQQLTVNAFGCIHIYKLVIKLGFFSFSLPPACIAFIFIYHVFYLA